MRRAYEFDLVLVLVRHSLLATVERSRIVGKDLLGPTSSWGERDGSKRSLRVLGVLPEVPDVSELIGYPFSGLTFNSADGWTVGLCGTPVRGVRLLVVRKTPVPRRGPLRRRYTTAYQYSNSVYSTQAADITPP